MIELDVMTNGHREPKERQVLEAENSVRNDPPKHDQDVVVRFYEIKRGGKTEFYGVHRVLAARVAELRREVSAA